MFQTLLAFVNVFALNSCRTDNLMFILQLFPHRKLGSKQKIFTEMMNPLQSFLVRLLGRPCVISSEPLNMNIHTSNHICKKCPCASFHGITQKYRRK